MCVRSHFGSRSRWRCPARGEAWGRHGAPAGGARTTRTTGLRAARSMRSKVSPRLRRRVGAAARSYLASAQGGEHARRSVRRRRTSRDWELRLAGLRPAGASALLCGRFVCTQGRETPACGGRAADGWRQTLRPGGGLACVGIGVGFSPWVSDAERAARSTGGEAQRGPVRIVALSRARWRCRSRGSGGVSATTMRAAYRRGPRDRH